MNKYHCVLQDWRKKAKVTRRNLQQHRCIISNDQQVGNRSQYDGYHRLPVLADYFKVSQTSS